MRYAIAIVVAAVGLAAAVFVHQRTTPCVGAIYNGCNYGRHRPSWEDPVAVLLGLGGVAVAVGIAARRRRA